MYLQGSGRGWQQKEVANLSIAMAFLNSTDHSVGQNWLRNPTYVQGGLGMKSLAKMKCPASFSQVLWLSCVISQNAGRLGAESVLTQISCSTGQDNT